MADMSCTDMFEENCDLDVDLGSFMDRQRTGSMPLIVISGEHHLNTLGGDHNANILKPLGSRGLSLSASAIQYGQSVASLHPIPIERQDRIVLPQRYQVRLKQHQDTLTFRDIINSTPGDTLKFRDILNSTSGDTLKFRDILNSTSGDTLKSKDKSRYRSEQTLKVSDIPGLGDTLTLSHHIPGSEDTLKASDIRGSEDILESSDIPGSDDTLKAKHNRCRCNSKEEHTASDDEDVSEMYDTLTLKSNNPSTSLDCHHTPQDLSNTPATPQGLPGPPSTLQGISDTPATLQGLSDISATLQGLSDTPATRQVSNRWSDRLDDLGTALKWIRQEVLQIKQEDRFLMRRLLDLRAQLHRLQGLPSHLSLSSNLALLGSCSSDMDIATWSSFLSLDEEALGRDPSEAPMPLQDILMSFQNQLQSLQAPLLRSGGTVKRSASSKEAMRPHPKTRRKKSLPMANELEEDHFFDEED